MSKCDFSVKNNNWGKNRQKQAKTGSFQEYNDWIFEGMRHSDASFYKEFKKPQIKRDRQWYWMWVREKTKGKGAFNRILSEWNNKHKEDEIVDINIIEQGVSNYRQFLRR